MDDRKQKKMKGIGLQAKIRAQAMEMQDALRDLSAWESTIVKRDQTLKAKQGQPKKKKKLPPVRGFVTKEASFSAVEPAKAEEVEVEEELDISTSASGEPEDATSAATASAAAHTYDIGYKRWENFDEDTAVVREVDPSKKAKKKAVQATPASISSTAPTAAAAKPVNINKKRRKRAKDVALSREEVERQDGNNHFKAGSFNEAIKCYTRCVALNPENAIAYSNRAMAQLRLSQFRQAEEDCNQALEIDAGHVKSLLRRGTARNSLGRHREAYRDFERAAAIAPSNKKARSELRKTNDLRKSAMRKAPRRRLQVEVVGGPALPSAALASAPAPAAPAEVKAEPKVVKAKPEPEVVRAEVKNEVAAAAAAPEAGARAGEQAAAVADAPSGSQQPKRSTRLVVEETGSGSDSDSDDGPPPLKEEAGAAGGDDGDVGSSSAAVPAAAPASNVIVDSDSDGETVPSEAAGEASAAASGGSEAEAAVAPPPAPRQPVVVLPTVPSKAPRNGYEFSRTWRSLKKHPELRGRYLRVIPSKSFAKLLGTSLECELVLELVDILQHHIAAEKPVFCRKVMRSLTKASRFGMVLKFFSSRDKAAVQELFATLEAAGEDCGKLRGLYKL